MKNRINSRLSLAAINRSLAAVGERVDRNSFARPVAAPVEIGQGSVCEVHFGDYDNAFWEPKVNPVIFGGFEEGGLDLEGYDPRVNPLMAKLLGHDRYDDVRGLGEGCADMVRDAIEGNRDAFNFSSDGGFDDLGDDERDAFNRALVSIGEEI